MQVQSLHQKDFLEEGMETHPSIPALRIPWMEEPGGQKSLAGYSPYHRKESDTVEAT